METTGSIGLYRGIAAHCNEMKRETLVEAWLDASLQGISTCWLLVGIPCRDHIGILFLYSLPKTSI